LSKPDKKLLVLTNSKVLLVSSGPFPLSHAHTLALTLFVLSFFFVLQTFIRPKCKHYLAWGFSDFSLRLLATEGEKRVVVWDNIEVWGQLRHVAVSEDGKQVVTGGTDAVPSFPRVCVCACRACRVCVCVSCVCVRVVWCVSHPRRRWGTRRCRCSAC
jgi:hypothetical protein